MSRAQYCIIKLLQDYTDNRTILKMVLDLSARRNPCVQQANLFAFTALWL